MPKKVAKVWFWFVYEEVDNILQGWQRMCLKWKSLTFLCKFDQTRIKTKDYKDG